MTHLSQVCEHLEGGNIRFPKCCDKYKYSGSDRCTEQGDLAWNAKNKKATWGEKLDSSLEE